jgi:hypothetical protein
LRLPRPPALRPEVIQQDLVDFIDFIHIKSWQMRGFLPVPMESILLLRS